MRMKQDINLLMVDDNPDDVSLIKELFYSIVEGLKFNWVKDGYDAIDFINYRNKYTNAERPDLILLDLAMPKMSGYEVLQEINQSNYSDIPVVVLTTSCNPKDKKICEDSGVWLFISKPYDFDGYEKIVKKIATEIFPIVTTKYQFTNLITGKSAAEV